MNGTMKACKRKTNVCGITQSEDNPGWLGLDDHEWSELLGGECPCCKKENIWYCLVTVNPRADVTLEEFLRKYRKCCKKKWIQAVRSCIEWRIENANGDGEGMHLHMMLQYVGKAKCEIRREVYNTFKNLVGNIMHVNYQFNTNYGNFITYVDGFRGGVKKSCWAITHRMRENNGLDDII